mmetsp:Transcript_24219/g.34907  ORF Transcript_24219/g.34907 Transcript_24219/m.34907 type:complete len:80 (+) Transcript_24219:1987-2226(+)
MSWSLTVMRQPPSPNGLRAVSPSREYLYLPPGSSMRSWLTDTDEVRLLPMRHGLKRPRPRFRTPELKECALLPVDAMPD